jgi:hypothetical protein
MNLGPFDRFCLSLKTRAQLEERVDLNKFDRNREKYVSPMHIKKNNLIEIEKNNFWTNKWMQEPRNCILQVQHCDPNA